MHSFCQFTLLPLTSTDFSFAGDLDSSLLSSFNLDLLSTSAAAPPLFSLFSCVFISSAKSVWISPASQIVDSSIWLIHIPLSGRPRRFVRHMASAAIVSSSFLHSCCLQGAPDTIINHKLIILEVWAHRWDGLLDCVLIFHPIAAVVKEWCFASVGSQSCRNTALSRVRLFSLLMVSWAESSSGSDSTTLRMGEK